MKRDAAAEPAPPTASGAAGPGNRADAERGARRDDRWLDTLMNVAFLTLLCGALLRFLINHPDSPRLPWVIGLSAALAVLQLAGPRLTPRLSRTGPRRAELLRFGLSVGCWVVVVLLAPSFAWCAVPLIYTGLRALPERGALALVAVLSTLVVYAEWQLRTGIDPNLFLLPPTVAALATGVFLYMRRQADRLRALVDDLIRTRRELAATERREGTLAERQRLSMEIHDTLAQGLSSQQMLLQAAERTWDSDPATARGHVRTAESIAERSLAEARRFVHDLAPADLAEGGGLAQALRALAGRESDGALRVRVLVDGAPAAPLPARVQSELLRIAQGALANVREHAAASLATITLTHLGDQVLLDVADDGRGFPAAELPAATPGPAPAAGSGPVPVTATPGAPPGHRGHGIAAMRARAGRLGGVLTVESTPGEGTVVSAAIPLERK
ncbi:sensor histidine kinase [Streptomyces tsukubensis]|uniref:Oxygen sensor histidine kinase NreB n=2 Tax=Streptomyces TaxID=1883 RepID=A0A7G3UHQ1_STRT9|nr:sensor histidine kinase [Streptomyces tsukubensis]AZK94827.1 two-component sensor histidine kinase [Streptomyces tsukubensis]QKM69091.1 two-component sensor histidine kinase [Streptomyces tsukubensis NRRL18488]TAI40686.1 sensor histidine kinase [Streptomyces tsukubensis]